MKTCLVCKESKPLELFYIRENGKPRNDCICCHKKRCKDYDEKTTEKRKTRAKNYYQINKEKIKVKAREYEAKNKGRMKEKRSEYYKKYWAIPEKAAMHAFSEKVRYTKKRTAIPKWADLGKIKVIYQKASEFGFDVDHIVPLKSKIVCGLHVIDNLQLLCGEENSRKGNRIWPDMP